MIDKKACGLGLALLLAALPAHAEGGKKLYRYQNKDGVIVLDFQIPQDAIYRGYTVLSPTGSVLEVVPPSPTPEERAKLMGSDADQAKAAEEQRKRNEEDRRLLTMYSNVADAERARDRKLEALDLQISVDKGNVVRLQTDLDSTQELAANKERAGQKVPEEFIKKIESLSRQITTLNDGIKAREKDKDGIRASAAQDIQRLQFLLAHPEVMAKLHGGKPAAAGP